MQTRRWRQLALLEKFRGEGKRTSFKIQLYLSLFPTPIPITLCLLPTRVSLVSFGGWHCFGKFFSGIFPDECSSTPKSDIHGGGVSAPFLSGVEP